jgi:hypothetical protein
MSASDHENSSGSDEGEYEKDFVVGDDEVSESDENDETAPRRRVAKKSKRLRLRKRKTLKRADKEDLELVMDNIGFRSKPEPNIDRLEEDLFDSEGEAELPREKRAKPLPESEPAPRRSDLIVEDNSDSERSEGEIMDAQMRLATDIFG